jgi:hypothetical protein
VILSRIWGEQGLDYGSWAVQRDADEMEQAVWEKRNVEILELDLARYVDDLNAAVQERIAAEAVT